MDYFIPTTHPLARYHRAPADLRREREAGAQWGSLRVEASFPTSGCPAGSYQSVTLTFTVGSLGLDENGGLRLSFRFVSDMGRPQGTDPAADDYVSARTNGQADLNLRFEAKGNRRPFQPSLLVDVRNASLREGDTITVVLGDRSGGSRGWRQQTFCEAPFPIRVSVDPLGTHVYQDLPRDVGWDILPAAPERFVVNLPSHATVGETLVALVKAEDAWGNPLRDASRLEPRLRPRRLLAPDAASTVEPSVDLALEDATHERGVWSVPVRFLEPGCFQLEAEGELGATAPSNPVTGNPVTSNPVTSEPVASNPVVVVAEPNALPAYRHNWCDLHGQTGETVGVGTVRDYFDFARRYGFLDGSVHQGNDFQVSDAIWNDIKAATEAAYEAGAFVTFPGYEWSGTTSMGGDHNVIFHEPDPPIYRSSGWLIGDPYEQTAPLDALYRELAPHRAMTIAHIGGRPAALETTEPALESLWEIHSAWGTFEWVCEESAARGFKVGFVCNSDGHKCRPGASYPGAGMFGTLGGLTCVLAERRDRDSFWEALRQRRTYGTTGQRIVVEASMNGKPIGSEVRASRGLVRARVVGTAPVTRIDLLRGGTVVQTRWAGAEDGRASAYTGDDGGAIGRRHELEPSVPAFALLRFGGARVKGRARMVRWTGAVSVEGNAFASSRMHGTYGPAFGIRSSGRHEVRFACVTTGNLVNLLLELEEGARGTLRFDTDVTSFALDLASLDPASRAGDAVNQGARTMFEAPLDQRVEVAGLRLASLSHVLDATFEVEAEAGLEVPYYLRVTQLDEGRAWTSPFYLTRP